MPEKKKFLSEDRQYAQQTFYRWLSKFPKNRDNTSSDYRDEWVNEQCFTCQYYVKLTGVVGMDWGVCSNPLSPLDGRVTYEHDGCNFFSFAEDEDNF